MYHYKSGDWKCISCGENNFSSRTNCRRCGNNTNSYRNQNNDDWICTQCNYSNFKKNKSCRQCNTSRFNDNVSINIRNNDWFCPYCKTHQFSKNTKCRDCNVDKPIDEQMDNFKCIICFNNMKNSSLIHGSTAHTITCYDCAQMLLNKPCPVCRQNVTQIIKNYI